MHLNEQKRKTALALKAEQNTDASVASLEVILWNLKERGDLTQDVYKSILIQLNNLYTRIRAERNT